MESEILTLSGMSDKNRIYNKTSVQESPPSKNRIFQILFLLQDDRVEVIETEKIDTQLLMNRLEQGQSVFITPKSQRKIIPPKLQRKTSPFKYHVKEHKPWYFAHL